MALKDKYIGFIGAGNMAQAIGEGLIKRGVLEPSRVFVSAPSTRNFGLWQSLGVNTTHNNIEVIKKCDVVILAFKPYQLNNAFSEDIAVVQNSKLFVSILVGTPCHVLTKKIQNEVQSNARIIRVLPNVAVATGEGCSIMTATNPLEEDLNIVHEIFSPLGGIEEIPESLMDSAAALSASGPAFVFLMIEALADGGVKQGIPRKLAQSLAVQMIIGAAKLVQTSNKHPGQLKDEVCSPGGTSICGIHELERGNLRGILMNAIVATSEKAKEISRGVGN